MWGKRARRPVVASVTVEEKRVKVETKKKRAKTDAAVKEEVAVVKKVAQRRQGVTTVAQRLESEKWKITTGERVRSATGELRLNPSITTVPFLPVHEREKELAKVVTWNVAGLRAVLSKSSFARWIAEEDPVVVCLQETKTNSKKKDGVPSLDVAAPGYVTYWAHAEKPGYSGVATLTKVPPLSVRVGMGREKHDAEGRVLTLEFERFFLVNTYAPNAGGGLKNLPNRRDYNRHFQEFVAELGRTKHVVVAGDLNVAPEPIDLYNPKAHENSACFSREEREDFRELLRGAGLIDTWRELNPVADASKSLAGEGTYTFWSFRHNLRGTNRGWRLDHMLVSAAMRPLVHKAFIRRELLGSDHTAIGLLLDKSLMYNL
jgi:exodeoxyribonuclease-3